MDKIHLLLLIVSAVIIALCFMYFKIKTFRKILQFYLLLSALVILIGIFCLLFYNFNDLSAIGGINVIYIFPIIGSIYLITNFVCRKKTTLEDVVLKERVNKLFLINIFLLIFSTFVIKNTRKYILISITNDSHYTKELSLIAKYNQFGRFRYKGDSIKVLKPIGVLYKETSTIVLLNVLKDKNYTLYLRSRQEGENNDYRIESIANYAPNYRVLRIKIAENEIYISNNKLRRPLPIL